MINQWIKSKVEPLKEESVIILKDPQRMIQPGDFALDDWAKTNGFTMLMCTGNLALRAWYENFRDDPEVKLLLVDRSRVYPKRPPPVLSGYPGAGFATSPDHPFAASVFDRNHRR